MTKIHDIDPLAQTIVIDDRLDSYTHFYDRKLGQQLMSCTKDTVLELPSVAFCLNLKAASNTMRLPWLTVGNTVAWGRAFTTNRSTITQTTSLMKRQLPERMASVFTRAQKLTMGLAIDEICKAADQMADSTARSITNEEIWREFTNDNNAQSREFKLSIWGSQRIGYSATYFAYENFIRECVGNAKGVEEYSYKKIEILCKDVLLFFGQTALDKSVMRDEINIARLIRNSLAHSRGLETKDIPKDHGIRVEDGVLQIMAPDTRKLMLFIQERAIEFSEEGLLWNPELRKSAKL